MKKIFIAMLALLPVAALAQDMKTFLINSKVGNLNMPARAYLMYRLGANTVTDSAQITNGNFVLQGHIINPTQAIMVIDRQGVGIANLDTTADNLSFYLDKGTMQINSADSVAKAKITGSKINDDNKKLTAQLKPILDEARKLNAEEKAATQEQWSNPDFQNKMQARHKQLELTQKATLKIFIAQNPDSYLSLLALYSVGGPSPDPNELEPIYNSLSDSLKTTEAAKVFRKQLDELKVTAVGATAPDFTQNDVNGAPVKLSSFRGQYVLLDFWASWCGPCRQENPNVVKAYNKYRDKNFTILSVSLDKEEGKANWLAAIKSDGLTWTQVSDLKFWNNQAAALYYISAIPANFLIDPNGKIIAKNLRGADLDAKLAEVLGKEQK